MTTTISTSDRANQFGVIFGGVGNGSNQIINNRMGSWKNPYTENAYTVSIISPYMPSDNTDLVNIFSAAFNSYKKDTKAYDECGCKLYELRDAFIIMSPYLDTKDLVNFSEVNKCCYLILNKLPIQFNMIWEIQCRKLFPNITLKPKETCSFSAKEQFQIYFKRLSDEQKPYKAQFDRNNLTLATLRGSHGNDGEIAQLQKELDPFGGQATATELQAQLNQSLRTALQQNANFEQYFALYNLNQPMIQIMVAIQGLLNWQECVAGKAYDGTAESIDKNSQQALCQVAIRALPTVLDNQEKFEEFIEKAEVAKNNASRHDGPIPQDNPDDEEETLAALALSLTLNQKPDSN